MKKKSSDFKHKIIEELVDNSEILIYVLDENSNLQFINSAFEKLAGYNSSELLGRNFWEIFCPENLGSQEANFFSEKEGVLKKIDLLIKDKKGNLITLDLDIISTDDEESAGILCYGIQQIDASGNMKKLLELQNDLETKNEELDSFAHTVAHDLKNPLGVLLGFTDILLKEYENLTQDQLFEVLNSIKKTGFKMRSIIKELLLLSEVRKERVHPEPIDMKNCLKEALSRVEDMIERNRAELNIAEGIPDCLGYFTWVEEIWVNYLNNAIKFGARPPKIEIGFENLEGNRIKYWVKDNGNGIDVEEQKKLFVPFTRLQVVRAEGHGLGLSIVYTIVEKLNGSVGIESETGKGSKFYFILPKE